MFESYKTRENHSGRDQYPVGRVMVPAQAGQLLAHSAHQRLLVQIRELSQLPEEMFTAVYQTLIDRFAEFVQVLPETLQHEIGSLLNNALSRGLLVLQELHQYARQQLRIATAPLEINPLLAYALFSATLLRDIANIVSDYKVIICDVDGFFVNQWNPWLGSLLEQHAEYYRVYPIEGIYDRVEYSLTILLARQIMPVDGFNWLLTDTAIFVEWLEALKNELQIEGKIIDILRAVNQVEKEQSHLLEFLPAPEVKSIDTPKTQYGEAFYRWLRQEIAKGNLNVNSANAFIHRVQAGIFLEYPGLAREFSKIYGAPVQMNVVFVQFGNLFGIMKKSGQDFTFEKYFSTYHDVARGGLPGTLSAKQDATRSGLVIDSQLLFSTDKLPPVSENMRALENTKSLRYTLPASQFVPGKK